MLESHPESWQDQEPGATAKRSRVYSLAQALLFAV